MARLPREKRKEPQNTYSDDSDNRSGDDEYNINDSPAQPSSVLNRPLRSSSETFRNSPKRHHSEVDSRGSYGRATLFKGTVVALLLIILIFYFTNDIIVDGQKGLIPRFSISLGIVFVPTLLYLPPVSTRRTAAAFLYFELCTLFMNISTSVAWYRNPRELGSLPDIGHDLVGEWPETYTILNKEFHTQGICDNLILSLAVATILFTSLQPNASDIWRRFIMVYGTLNLMRTFTVLLTSLPDASPLCRELTPKGDISNGAWTWGAINNKPILWEIFIHTLMITIPVHPVTCGDMIFSGHSNTALCLALVWHTYYKWVPSDINLVKSSAWLIAFGAILGLIGTHVHYTIDVVLSVYFSITVWSAYHRLAIDVALGRRFISVWWIDANVIYPAMEWLETPLEKEEIFEWTKERDEMNLFELQILEERLDGGHVKRWKRSQEVKKNRTPKRGNFSPDFFEEKKD